MSIDETRPVLTGSLLECKDGTATMVSCDSFRVAVRKAEIEDENLELKIIIPGRILGEVSKYFRTEDEDMNIFCTRNQVQFDMENTSSYPGSWKANTSSTKASY